MSKKGKYANSKWILRNLVCCCSNTNLSNDDIIGPFIRGKIRSVLCKTRLIFPRINGPIVLMARSKNGLEKMTLFGLK